jgi:small ligand-binding sensory domain FIST
MRKQDPSAGEEWHVMFVFTCGDFNEHFVEIVETIREAIPLRHVIGCTAEAVLGIGREVEDASAISMLALRTNRRWTPLRLEFVRSADGGSIIGWPDDWSCDRPAETQIVLLGDPFTFPAEVLLEQLDDDHPGIEVFGGMASGAARPGDNRLAHGDTVFADGAVGVVFHDRPWSSLVSQGCRPIGRTFVITKVEGNVILELGGLPAYSQLMTVYEQLPNREKQQAQQGLHLGRVVSEYLDEYAAGDFLIRNVVGASPDEQTIAVGDYMRVGQTVQFHLRDVDSADLDLKQGLQAIPADQRLISASLLFTCNGRGTRMFPQANHDAAALQAELGDIPLAGFFAQGEIGPVGGNNFLHGLTASLITYSATYDSKTSADDSGASA